MTVVYTIMRSTPFTYPELIGISCKEVEAQKVCDVFNSDNTSHSKKNLDSLLVKLKQNPKQLKDLIRHKIVINLPEEESEAQKVINSIKENKNGKF